jgi:diguanylate cyclase (GGDEF)-like protein
MRWPAAGLLAAGLALLLACALPAAAAASGTPPPLELRDDGQGIDPAPALRMWVDPGSDAGIDQVARLAATAAFQPPPSGVVQQPRGEGAVWLHWQLRRAAGDRQEWLLTVPMTVVDRVTVHQRNGASWRAGTAGDTVPVNTWPERGRYPAFRLDLPEGEARDVFVRIQHATPATFPLLLTTAARHGEQSQMEYLGLGAAFGAMLLLIVGCAARGWVYRDAEFGWYAVYAGLTSLAVASYTGVAPHLLWPGVRPLEDAPTSMLGCAAAAAALLFVRNTLGLRRRMPVQARLTLVAGAAGALAALMPVLLPKALYLHLVGGYITLATLMSVAVAAAAWWRGDPVGKWVFAAQVPMVTSVLLNIFRTLGWATDLPFVSQSFIVMALAIEVPLLLVALFMRSRDRHSAEVREQALSTQDALTGLLAPHLFHDRLRHVVARHRRNSEDAAVMYIDLVNHGPIRDYFGTAVAEQSLLRSVIKLRRLLRDVDTVARVGEARFGVILEGASSRSSVTERATRLVAAGLMPLPGLKPDVTLQFHVVALMLSDMPMEADEVQQALATRLAKMSPRTRRPIRFVEPDVSPASDNRGPDSSLLAQEPLTPEEAEYVSAP